MAYCKVQDCGRPVCARGYCSAHYARVRTHGDPLAHRPVTPKRGDRTARFMAKVDLAGHGGCWLWTAAVDPTTGYGKFHIGPDQRTCGAHRFAYELLVGPIPDGLVLDHLCRVRHCVNPQHLEPVTVGENLRRGRDAA